MFESNYYGIVDFADNPNIYNAIYNLRRLYANQSKRKEAKVIYQQAMEGFTREMGPEHKSTSETIHGLANIYYSEGKFEEAKAMYQQVLEVDKNLCELKDA